MQNKKQLARKMIDAALNAVDPYNLIKEQIKQDGSKLEINGDVLDLNHFENIYLVGAGKGCAPMAAAMEALLGDRLKAGVITVKYEHGQPLKKTKITEAGHPIPDENSLRGTREILHLLDHAENNDLVFVLITGGGSALLEDLPEGITLNQLAETNKLLLASGAVIDEINTIRKHISLVKAGQLTRAIYPARAVTLILSDVIGDPLQSIASGPTAPDNTTFGDASRIVERYGLQDKLPENIMTRIIDGAGGAIDETPGADDPVFNHVKNYIIGNNRLALNRMQDEAQQAGYKTLILTDSASGEAREAARFFAAIVRSAARTGQPLASPGCLIFGGETTVTLRGSGKGGRNQELVLAALNALRDMEKPFYFCSVGSDGNDGPTDAAGAWIDQNSYQKTLEQKLDIDDFLDRNDAYHFFEKLDQLIKTGPTRTNVMDMAFCLF